MIQLSNQLEHLHTILGLYPNLSECTEVSDCIEQLHEAELVRPRELLGVQLLSGGREETQPRISTALERILYG